MGKRRLQRMKEKEMEEKDEVGITEYRMELRERRNQERFERQKQRLEAIKAETNNFWQIRDNIKTRKNAATSEANLNEKCFYHKREEKEEIISKENLHEKCSDNKSEEKKVVTTETNLIEKCSDHKIEAIL